MALRLSLFMGLVVLLALWVPRVKAMGQADEKVWRKLGWNADTFSTRVPRYLRQGRPTHLGLVKCERAEVRLKGTRSEQTDLSLSLLTTTLPVKISTPIGLNVEFYSQGPAKMKANEYYLFLLTQNTDGQLEPQPQINASFSLADGVYQLIDHQWVSEKEAYTDYDREAKNLETASKNIE